MIVSADQKPKFVLASSSQYRQAQLQSQLALNLESVAPNIDETPRRGETARQTALRLSLAKAKRVAKLIREPAVIIAGDQTAKFETTQLTKPMYHERAVEQLLAFSGHEVLFYSGICVMEAHTSKQICDAVETRVLFRRLDRRQIERYLKYDRPYDCVGAFKNEGLGIALFESIESQDPTALTGLPLITLTSMLLSLGLDVLASP